MQVAKAIALQKQHVSFVGSNPTLPAKIKLWKVKQSIGMATCLENKVSFNRVGVGSSIFRKNN